jgi:enoyl-CoA hydratase
MDYSHYRNLKIEKEDKVAIVTMNRPETLNAVSYDMHEELVDIFHDLAKDDSVWVAILTGAGRAFSAGGDIRWFKKHAEDPKGNPLPPPLSPIQLLLNIVDLPKPLIAAVNGACMGLGATLALFCDIIIAAEDSRIADPHVSVGLAAGDGGCVIWPLLMGMAKAKEHLFTGGSISAQDAERMGIINKVVPADQLMSEAIAFARRLAAGAPLAMRYTKLSINKVLREKVNLIVPTSTPYEYMCFDTDDHKEAVNAFLEKRPARFKGT